MQSHVISKYIEWNAVINRLLPQLLDVWGDPREAVHAVHHAMLLDELGAALEDLGHCREKTQNGLNKTAGHHTTLLSVNIGPVFTESCEVKNVGTFLPSAERSGQSSGAQKHYRLSSAIGRKWWVQKHLTHVKERPKYPEEHKKEFGLLLLVLLVFL